MSEDPAAEPWVDTDPYGRVIDASPEGARLFNLSVRGLTGRNLSLFFISRQVIADGLQVLRRGHRECPLLETEYRPMERRRRRLRVKMGTSDGEAVRWTFSEVLGDPSSPLLNPTWTHATRWHSTRAWRRHRQWPTGWEAALTAAGWRQLLDGHLVLDRSRPGARRAYDRYRVRGANHGRDQEDWFEAERELIAAQLEEA